MKISIIGAGRLGGALAIALSGKGFEIEHLVARNRQKAERVAKLLAPPPEILSADNLSEITADVILIATQDSEIETVAVSLAKTIKHKTQVFHTSGSISSEILNKLKLKGCHIGSIHPLVSISDARLGADRLADAYFCIEGDEIAVKTAREIVGKLGGKPFSIKTEYKALYHASAVTASGHLTALISTSIEMLKQCGLPEKDAQTILLPLIKSTVENLEMQTASEALTGTFARADTATLGKHLEILQQKASPEALEIYLQLGMRSLDLAERQGADKDNLEKMRGQILLAKTNLKC